MKCLVLVLLAGVLSGCAAIVALEHRVVIDLTKTTVADAQAALDMNKGATDPEAPYRAECYQAVLDMAKSLPAPVVGPAPTVRGPLSVYEASAQLDRKIRGSQGGDLLPQNVRAKCAIIVLSVEEFFGRMGLKAGKSLIPGLSSLPGLP